EIRPIGDMVRRVALTSDKVTRLELDEAVRTGSDRLQVRGRSPRIGAFIRLEQMFRDDHPVRTDKGIRPEWSRLFEANADGQWIELFDLYFLVAADRRRRGRGVGGILAVEYDIISGEGPAVVPRSVLLDFPIYRHAVGTPPAILDFGDLGSKHRH